MSKCMLWVCNDDRKTLNKTIDIDNPAVTIPQTMFRYVEPMDQLRPSFILNSAGSYFGDDNKWRKLNYCRLEKFNRYYFCHLTTRNDGMIQVDCEVDPLMSYRAEIASKQFEVARSASINSEWYIDSERPIQANHYLRQFVLGAFPEASGNNYIMTVAGGGV